VLFVTASSQIH